MYAAYGGLMCLSTVKMAQLREGMQLAMIKRHNEIA
jgi:hypothetical protein